MIIKLYEKFTDISEVKDILFLKAVETNNIEAMDFFVKKGYEINIDYVLITACHNDNSFRYLLGKGLDVDEHKDDPDFKRKMKDLDVQKALIDFGHEYLIYSTVGFNNALDNDKKYGDVVKRMNDVSKYNM